MALGKDVIDLQKKISYHFMDLSYLDAALTHSSYTNEMRAKGMKAESNERLEFLGDAVLQLVISEYLFKNNAKHREGALTKMRQQLVCEKTLAKIAKKLQLGEYINLGNGEELGDCRSRPKILADAMEALIAAVYLDGGFDEAERLIIGFIRDKAEEVVKTRMTEDYKTALQEIVQKNHEEVLSYRLKSESGPDHDKRFVVEVLINSNVLACGEGKSKKAAEQAAAKLALELMGQ